jgi:hypothetical protein
MTRTSLNTTLRRLYILLGALLVLSLLAKFRAYIPGLEQIGLGGPLADAYEFLRDMSLLIATGGVAYLTNVFQKRSSFTESLEEEWRGIVQTKSTLYTFCEKTFPSTEDYLTAFAAISGTIDNMRIVYRNVGETDELIGLYPYAPLHDMRRLLQTLDPRKRQDITPDERKLVRDGILQAFYAVRETFLEELDLEEPSHALLATASRRRKRDGATARAVRVQDTQQARLAAGAGPRPEIDALLLKLRNDEKAAGQKR